MQVTVRQFSALVLAALGYPVTDNNIDKIAAVAKQEGKHGTFNPFNYVTASGQAGETNYNSVGVKNYPDLQTGVIMTTKLLSQNNTKDMAANLKNDGSFADFLRATSSFYRSWGGGNIIVSQTSARQYQDALLEGDTTNEGLQLVINQVSADKGGTAEWIPFVTGIHGETGSQPTGGGVFGDLPANEKGPLSGLSNPLDILQSIASWVGNVQNWKNVALVVGGGLLVLMGLYLLAGSFGVSPSIPGIKR